MDKKVPFSFLWRVYIRTARYTLEVERLQEEALSFGHKGNPSLPLSGSLHGTPFQFFSRLCRSLRLEQTHE